MVQNEVISEVSQELQSGQNDQNLRFWAWVCEVQTGPPAQRQLVQGLAAASLQDPQRGPKWSKLGQI